MIKLLYNAGRLYMYYVLGDIYMLHFDVKTYVCALDVRSYVAGETMHTNCDASSCGVFCHLN